MSEPSWLTWARNEAKQHPRPENEGDNHGRDIRRYIELAKAGHEGDPYCAIGVNAALEANGLRGTRSAAAKSFSWGDVNFVKLDGPSLGAITVFWRQSKSSGFGHVGMYIGETADHIYVLGFNQHDGINETPFPKSGQSWGLVGYFWPKSVPAPVPGRIILKGDGTPVGGKVT